MTWLRYAWPDVLGYLLQHLLIALPAIVLSIALSVPLGWLAHHHRRWRGLLVTGTGALYAIPSLPLLVLIPALTGLPLRSVTTMVVALTIYGVALLVGGAADAFDSIPADVRHAARAMGYPRGRMFWQVELPLAAPVILATSRVVIVSTVALVTIGAVVGIGSLGSLFTDGFQRGIVAEVLTGLVLTVALALTLDRLAVLAGHLLLPWRRA